MRNLIDDSRIGFFPARQQSGRGCLLPNKPADFIRGLARDECSNNAGALKFGQSFFKSASFHIPLDVNRHAKVESIMKVG
jgi:hypothetical protein